jgi:hypothetical protein
MAGHLLFNSGSNESSLAPQFKWLDNTFNLHISQQLISIFSVQYLPLVFSVFQKKILVDFCAYYNSRKMYL